MAQDKFSWLDKYGAAPAPPLPTPMPTPGPTPPKPGEAEPQEKFSFLDQFAPGAQPTPAAPAPLPKKEETYGAGYVIKETLKGAGQDIGKVFRGIFPKGVPVTGPTIGTETYKRAPSARDAWEATQALVRGIPAFMAGMAGQAAATVLPPHWVDPDQAPGPSPLWEAYLRKGPLAFSGMDLIRALGSEQGKAAFEEIVTDLGYEPQTEGGAQLTNFVMKPIELADSALVKIAELSTTDPQMREGLTWMLRAAGMFAMEKGTALIKRSIKGKEGVNPGEFAKAMREERAKIPDPLKDDFDAYTERLEQMSMTSARAPEQVQTWAEMPRELVAPKPPTPRPPTGAAPAAPAPPVPSKPPVEIVKPGQVARPVAPEPQRPYTRTDTALREAITRVEKGEGSPEDIRALLSAAKRSERLKGLTEGYKGQLYTDVLTGVGSDRALRKVKGRDTRRQAWIDLKGVKEANNDPARGYRWVDENIFEPTGEVLRANGADAYRRGGTADEFIIFDKPGESAADFGARIKAIEAGLREKGVELRSVVAENMVSAEKLMGEAKGAEKGAAVPIAPTPEPGAGARPAVEPLPAGTKYPKPFKSHGFMAFDNINGKAWERARELVKDGWVLEYDHTMGKDGIARIVGKREPGSGDYYRAQDVPLKKLYAEATKQYAGRADRFGSRTSAARPLVTFLKEQGGISWEKIKEAGLEGEFAAILEGPNKDVIAKRKGKGISPWEALERAWEDGRISKEEMNILVEELSGRGKGKMTPEEVEASLAAEGKAYEREMATIQKDLDSLKEGKRKWEDLQDQVQEDLVAAFGDEELKGLAPEEEIRTIRRRLEEEMETEYPSPEEAPEWFAEVEKAELELKAEADRVIDELRSGRKKWDDLTGTEVDDVIEVYGPEVRERFAKGKEETWLERRVEPEAEKKTPFEKEPEPTLEDLADIEEALLRGRTLSKEQEARARRAGILEEIPSKGEVPEPPPTPEQVIKRTSTETPTGTMELVNLAVKTPADTIFSFNNVPAKDLAAIRAYARKHGIEDRLIVGDKHSGVWGEAYSPAEHLAHVREILRDVKRQPREVWESWEKHVKIDTAGLRPEDGPPVGIVAAGFASPGPAKNYLMGPGGRLYQGLLDQLHSLRKLGDFLRRDKIELFPENDPYIGARLYAGVQGKAELWLLQRRFKMVNGNMVYGGPSLSDILKPVRRDIENFSRYLVYRRVPELAARGIETGIDVGQARAFTTRYASKFERQAKEFTKYHNELLDELVDAGRISAEKADIIKSMNPNYASFQRVMDDIAKYGYVPTSAKFLAKIPNPVKAIRGSERPIIDPIESAIKATYVMHNVAERARINRQVIALRDLHPEIAKVIKPTKPAMELVATLEDGTKVFRPKKNQPEGIIESWKEGERHYYEVPVDLYQSLAGLGPKEMGWFLKLMALPSRILRTGATTSPEFAFRNPFRDQWSATANAKYGFFPGIDFVRGLFHMVGKSDAYNAWKASGGDWAMVTALDRATSQKKLKEVLGKRDYALFVKHPVKFLERMSMYGEMPSRLGAYARAKKSAKKAVTDIEAAYMAREATVDFARRGAWMQVPSALYTFFNARLEGVDRLVRSFKERPVQTTAKVLAVATIPSVINYLVNRDDPKYWEIPRWQRNLFWIFKVKIADKDRYIRIPKGDVGVMFGTPAEIILEHLDRDPAHRQDIEQFAVDLFKETLPISDWGGLSPAALRPLFENYTNFNFFKKRSIVPMGMERLEPEFQAFPYTTETAKELGKILNYPPAKIENFIRGYTGGMGQHALRMLDQILQGLGEIPKAPAKPKEPADIPGVRAFFVRDPEGFGSESTQKFYDTMKKLDTVKQTHSMLSKEKRKEELDEYVGEHPAELKALEGGFYSAFVKVRNELSEIRKAQDRIYEDKTLDVRRKALGLELLDRKIMLLVIPLMNRYVALEEKYGKVKR